MKCDQDPKCMVHGCKPECWVEMFNDLKKYTWVRELLLKTGSREFVEQKQLREYE